jgi:hypothetical protein
LILIFPGSFRRILYNVELSQSEAHRLGLDDTSGPGTHIEETVCLTLAAPEGKLAHSDAPGGVQVEISQVLHIPTGQSQQFIDALSCLSLEAIPRYKEWVAILLPTTSAALRRHPRGIARPESTPPCPLRSGLPPRAARRRRIPGPMACTTARLGAPGPYPGRRSRCSASEGKLEVVYHHASGDLVDGG